MTRLPLALSKVAAVAVAAAIALGCARHYDGEQDGGPVIDVELMAFLSEARALHHQANLKEDANDLPGAAAAMRRLVGARRPHQDPRRTSGAAATPEVEEVLADAYARLAELELRQHALGPASEAIAAGLSHAPGPTYFRGHLIEVQGLVEEARARGLADAGRPEESARAREKAIQLLEEVVRIQDQVIQRSLTSRDGGTTEGKP